MATDSRYNREPYYDDYDPDKKYTRILAVPGRVEQAREFTQAQSITQDYLGRLGDSIYSNGTIISGCVPVVSGKKVTISSGRLYLDGLVRNVDGQVLEITGVGDEKLGAKIKTEIVTELEDSTLKDPAQNFENYGQGGAHRVKETVIFTVNDEDSATIYSLNNGAVLRKEANSNDDAELYEILARRTFDENGSYKVRGLELRDRKEANSKNILISVTEGKAYVKGFEVTKQAATTLSLDFASDSRDVMNEIHYYSTSQANYDLNNVPVKSISNLSAYTQVKETITRGNQAGGIDYVSNTPLVKLVSIVKGSTTYKEGTDYQMSSNGIDWSPLNGNEPDIGETYVATYIYNKTYKAGTEYKLVNTLDSSTEKYRSYITFTSSVKPVTDGTGIIQVNYDFWLARKDLITMSSDGSFNIYKGYPDVEALAESPINQNDEELTIGTVLISAGYSSNKSDANLKHVIVATYDTTRLSQANLYNMKRRIDDLEYNVALSDLDKEASSGEAPTELKGIFTDGFIGLSKCDTSHSEFDCSIDLDSQELTLPVNESISAVSVDDTNSNTQISNLGNVVMAPFSSVSALSQPYATQKLLINEHAVYNPLSVVQLTPSSDTWIEDSTVTINKSNTVSTTLRRWWKHRGDSWAESEKTKWEALTGTTGEQLDWSNYDNTSTTKVTDVVLDEAIMYMRQIKVQVTGTNFTPNVDNVQCFFNDTQVPLTAKGSTSAGTTSGTVKANSSGEFAAEFTVPSNVPCGSVNVVLKSPLDIGSAVFTSNGRKIEYQDTVLTTRTIVKTQDPLSQSFSFEDDTILTKLDLYFATKDPNKAVVIQIRDMINGYPGTTVYDEVVVRAADIKISSDASAVTSVSLSQPVYCHANTQYCLCVLSDSNLYSLYIATLGDSLLDKSGYVTSQPYNAGVLFTSSNGLTWSALQDSDLKFTLYRAQYSKKGEIIFNNVTFDAVSSLVLAVSSVDYKNNGLNWFYRLGANNTTGVWTPLYSFSEKELESKSQVVQLKCVIGISNSSSPIIAKNNINLVGFINKERGTYVSRTVTLTRPYNTLNISFEGALPTGTSAKVYYSVDNLNWNEVTDPTRTVVDTEFNKFDYTVSNIQNQPKKYKIKIVMTTNNPLIKPRIRKLMSIMKTI